MQTVHTLPDLHDARRRLGPCALVPTMGNLHAGHLSLIARARESGLPVVTSIFVNPLQFAPTDDFDRYPRTLDADCAQLDACGCDLVFAPREEDLYAQPQRFKVSPDPALADILEGHFRPGFFVGVCTVVMKLFCCVQPQVAVFGKKDYQQWRIIRRMVEQFALPIDILAGETVRASNGLALSSRNSGLDAGEQAQASELSGALAALIEASRRHPGLPTELESQAMSRLAGAGWKPDYLTIRRSCDLQPPTIDEMAAAARAAGSNGSGRLVALGAARLGTTRLIDNIEF